MELSWLGAWTQRNVGLSLFEEWKGIKSKVDLEKCRKGIEKKGIEQGEDEGRAPLLCSWSAESTCVCVCPLVNFEPVATVFNKFGKGLLSF